jgi:hypothetical protein
MLRRTLLLGAASVFVSGETADSTDQYHSGGLVNGRFWKTLTEAQKLILIGSAVESSLMIYSYFEYPLVQSPDKKSTADTIKANFLALDNTNEDILEKLNQIFSDPLNNHLPVIEVIFLAIRAFNGSFKYSLDGVLTTLRDQYRSK